MANARADIHIEGARELRNLCRELPRRVVKKGLRAAVTAASTPINRTAKATAPRESGLLKKAIGRKVKSYRGAAAAIVGARTNVSGEYRGRKRVPEKYLHLVNRGTRHSEAQPFLDDAYQANKAQAKTIAAAKLRSVVEGEARKLGRL